MTIFLQVGSRPRNRADVVCKRFFQVGLSDQDFNETASLEFVLVRNSARQVRREECHQRDDFTPHAEGQDSARNFGTSKKDARSIKTSKEQEVYSAEIPLMTGNGTFIGERHGTR